MPFRLTDIHAGAEHGTVNAARPCDWFDRAPVDFAPVGETSGYHAHAIGASFLILEDSASPAHYEYRAVGLPFESHEGWCGRRADGTTWTHRVVVREISGVSMVIPYGIRWPCFLANVVIYALMIGAIVKVVHASRSTQTQR